MTQPDKIVILTQVTGDYTQEEAEVLEEIYMNGYRGRIEAYGNPEKYHLVSFTYPYNRQNQRGKDGLTYLWVNEDDIEEVR
jgi:hypothetical protein